MRNKKVLIIVIMLIVVLAIVGAVVGFLLLSSGTIKSDKELFMQYVSQNFEIIDNLKDSTTYNLYNDLNKNGTYESNTNIKVIYSEGGEISNPFNDLSAKINTKKDSLTDYLYTDAQVLFKDEEYMEIERISNSDVTGIRFSDVAKQFITLKNGEDNTKISGFIGVKESELKDYLDVIDNTQSIVSQVVSKEEYDSLKEKYLNIVKETFDKASYENLKKVMLTVNSNTVQANAYTATFTSTQVGDMVIKILNNLKTDEIISQKAKQFGYNNYYDDINKLVNDLMDYTKFKDVKITVYQQDGVTIRTDIDMSIQKIIIEKSGSNAVIQRNILNSDKEENQTLTIIKNSSENEETYNISIDLVDGTDKRQIVFESKMKNDNSAMTINSNIRYSFGITNIAVSMDSVFNKVNELTEKVELNQNNNVTLNNLDENTQKGIIDTLRKNVPLKYETRVDLLKDVLGLNGDSNNSQEPTNDYEMTQTDINKFNSKFEFYTGETVSSDNVKTLFEVVKSNLGSMEITNITPEDGENNDNIEEKVKIKLTIEKGKENDELIKQALSKIKKDKKYKVSIIYKADNGIIDYITVEEIKE